MPSPSATPPASPVFQRLPAAKQRIILDAAAAEFARQGFYHEIGGEGLSDLGRDFCERFEGLSARVYAALLAEARSAGAVRADLDERYAAFCLDSLFVALQFSFACDYHRLRKAVYLGPERDADDEALVARVLQFLRYGLAGK